MPDQNTQVDSVTPTGSWMADVQRALAIMLVGTLCICIMIVTLRVVWSGDAPSLNDMAKTLQAALVNMGLIGLGFFFGNTIAKMQQDNSQQRLTDKLTSTAPGTLPPMPPGQTPAAVTPWWPKLTDGEKNDISAKQETDPRVRSIVMAMTSGSASKDDLDYIVAQGLLTQERATAIAAA